MLWRRGERRWGSKKVHLLGIHHIMDYSFYLRALSVRGMKIITPCEKEKSKVDRITLKSWLEMLSLMCRESGYSN